MRGGDGSEQNCCYSVAVSIVPQVIANSFLLSLINIV